MVMVRLRAMSVSVFVAVIVKMVDAKYVSLAIVITPPVVIVTPAGTTGVRDHAMFPASAELVSVNVSVCATAVTLRI
jgi:hypothetical protein